MADKIEQIHRSKSLKATVAFTLPISCQICLGKVKHPVCCENNHVFCKLCMDIWTSKNKHCPSCRVSITGEKPYKELLGGHAFSTETEPNFANPVVRKARVKSLFTCYEEEVQRLNDKITELEQRQNHLLRQKSTSKQTGEENSLQYDDNTIEKVNKKLAEATDLYQSLSVKLGTIQDENNSLKRANQDLTRENDNLRFELTQRTPVRHGRFTIATLEGQIDTHKKEICNLEKALARSDAYIEELREDLMHHKQAQLAFSYTSGRYEPSSSQKSGCSTNVKLTTERSSQENCETISSQFASIDNTVGNVKKNLFNPTNSLNHLTFTTQSSEAVERPARALSAPLDASALFGYSTALNQRSRLPDYSVPVSLKSSLLDNSETVRKNRKMPASYESSTVLPVTVGRSKQSPVTTLLADRVNSSNTKQSNPTLANSPSRGDCSRHDTTADLTVSTPTKRKRCDESSFDLEVPSPGTPSQTLSRLSLQYNRPQTASTSQYQSLRYSELNDSLGNSIDIEQELEDHNMTVTEELTDCLKLMNKAERKVKGRMNQSSNSSTGF